MKILNCLLGIAAGIAMTSCNNESEIDGSVFARSYIQVFRSAESVNLKIWQSNKAFIIEFVGKDIANNNPDRPEYDRLCQHFGDMSYNNKIVPFSTFALADEFESIDVVCDKEFAGIAAGESLGSITKIVAASADPYIRSGYTNSYNWLEDTMPDYLALGINFNYRSGYHPVNKTLDVLTQADIKLLDFKNVYFIFDSEPDPGTYGFTFTFKRAQNPLSAEGEMTF